MPTRAIIESGNHQQLCPGPRLLSKKRSQTRVRHQSVVACCLNAFECRSIISGPTWCTRSRGDIEWPIVRWVFFGDVVDVHVLDIGDIDFRRIHNCRELCSSAINEINRNGAHNTSWMSWSRELYFLFNQFGEKVDRGVDTGGSNLVWGFLTDTHCGMECKRRKASTWGCEAPLSPMQVSSWISSFIGQHLAMAPSRSKSTPSCFRVSRLF